MTDAELEAFQDALGDLGDRVSEFLTDGTDRTPEELEKAIAEYEMPDPLKDRSIDKE